MCAMNAMETNQACKALYERLRAKGKTGKQGLIAVCNKLLKQVFAVIKSQTLYQPNYCSPNLEIYLVFYTVHVVSWLCVYFRNVKFFKLILPQLISFLSISGKSVVNLYAEIL